MPFRSIPSRTGTGPAYPAESNGTVTEIPSIRAHALGDAEIALDGVLDEGVWQGSRTKRMVHLEMLAYLKAWNSNS